MSTLKIIRNFFQEIAYEGFPFFFIKRGTVKLGAKFYNSLTVKQRFEIQSKFGPILLIIFCILSIVCTQIFKFAYTEIFEVKTLSYLNYLRAILALSLGLILCKAFTQYYLFKYFQYYKRNKDLFQSLC